MPNSSLLGGEFISVAFRSRKNIGKTLLLQIRDAAADESKLEGRIRKFALARLDDLSMIESQASR